MKSYQSSVSPQFVWYLVLYYCIALLHNVELDMIKDMSALIIRDIIELNVCVRWGVRWGYNTNTFIKEFQVSSAVKVNIRVGRFF